MSRVSVVLIAIVCLLAGALGGSYIFRSAPGVTEQRVHEIAKEELAAQSASRGQIDPATLDPIIESYLMTNPRILERMSVALRDELNAEKAEKARIAIESSRDAIFNDPNQVVVGNPDGDVTLVEMFDYNCGYCRAALPDLATLISEDPNLKVILKEFPILSQDSVDAARIAVAFAETGADYWPFHEALFTSPGKITKQTALSAASDLGANPVTLELAAQDEGIDQIISRSFALAQKLSITGTPSFIIGDEIIPGAVGIDALRGRIENMRNCGKTVCES